MFLIDEIPAQISTPEQFSLILLNTNGYYDKLVDFFEEIISQNFARSNARKLYYTANTPQEAIEYLKNYTFENILVTKEQIYKR